MSIMKKGLQVTSAHLLMLGTIHRDKEGEVLLYSLLDKFRPDVITIEFSNYGLFFRQKEGPRLKGLLQKVEMALQREAVRLNEEARAYLYAYIDMPYEYRIADLYSRRHDAPCYLIDWDIPAIARLKKTDELFSYENIMKLLSSEDINTKNQMTYEKAIAFMCLKKGMRLFDYTEEMYLRDIYMSERIKRIMARQPEKRLVHICGWQHLVDPCDVYKPLSPAKVFLYDTPLCI